MRPKMKHNIIIATILTVFSISSYAQCSSSGNQWVGDNPRNYTPGAAGSKNSSTSSSNGSQDPYVDPGYKHDNEEWIAAAGGRLDGRSLGSWSGGSIGGQNTDNDMLNKVSNTFGLGSLTADKEFSLADAAKLASTATTAYGVVKGDDKLIALGMTGMAASNKFSGQIDSFGLKVADSASNAWKNTGSYGTGKSNGYDAEFGTPGAYDQAVKQQSNSNLGGWYSDSSTQITGKDVQQFTTIAGAAVALSGNGQMGTQIAQVGNLAGQAININSTNNANADVQYGALALQTASALGYDKLKINNNISVGFNPAASSLVRIEK